MELKGELVYNKDLWTLISSTFVNVTDETVANELNRAQDQLLCGINYYQRSTPEDAKGIELKNQLNYKLCSFVKKLETFLDLNFVQAYDLLCYYVMYEFRGSVEGMHELIGNEMKTRMLIQDIWLFYRSERMFLLRCVNLVWSYYGDPDHPFQKHYADLLSRYNVEAWGAAQTSQLHAIITDQLPTVDSHGPFMTERFQEAWFLSNLREQIQVIHNTILYLDFHNCSAADFEALYDICQSHMFGREQRPENVLAKEQSLFREKIGYVENIMLLQAMDLESLNLHTHKLYATEAERFERLNKGIAIQCTFPEQGPLLLAWMIVSFQHPTKDPSFGEYKRFGEKAVELDVFNYLARLLKSSMFQNGTKLGMVGYSCVYRLLVSLCESFSGQILMSLPGICVAVAAVLVDPAVKVLFWKSAYKSGLWGVVSEAFSQFPHQYFPLVDVVTSLALDGKEFIAKMLLVLQRMPTYMEAESLVPASCIETDDSAATGKCHLKVDRRPPDTIAVIPAGTIGLNAESLGEPTVAWVLKVSFVDVVVRSLDTLLVQISRGSPYVQAAAMRRGVAAVRCLAALLDNQCAITPAIDDAIGVVFQLMEKYSGHPSPPGELLGHCMDVCFALLTSFPDLVIQRLGAINFLPAIDTQLAAHAVELSRGTHLCLNTVGLVMANDESLSGKYPLLIAYLRFLDRVMQPNRNDTFEQTLRKNFDIILPGVVLIVRIVFPNYESWPYEHEVMDMNRVWIAHYCMQAMHLLVSVAGAQPDLSDPGPEQRRMEKTRDPVRRQAQHYLHTVCLHSLLQTDTCLPLLRLVATGDRYLQAMMEHQPSWLSGYGVLYMSNVQLAMSVLNRVLMLKRIMYPGKELCRIETLLYCQPTPSPLLPPPTAKLRVVLVVANYIYHCFHPALPVLAVRLLKRFALEFPVSLMSCLGVDGQQICQTFLGRLNSAAECAEMKVAILELVTASVASQPGLTEAFINLHNPHCPPRYEPGGCLNYACDTLQLLLKDPTSVPLGIHQAIVALIYELYMGETQSVLAYLRAKPGFWNGLLEPFHLDLIEEEATVYCQILTIVTLEVYWHKGKLERQLRANLDEFLLGNLEHLQRWCKFLLTVLSTTTDEGKPKPIVDGLVISWKEFLSVMIRFPTVNVDSDHKQIIGNTVSTALLQQLHADRNPNAVKVLADTYMLLVTHWGGDSWDDAKLATVQLQQILLSMASICVGFPPACNESLMAMCVRLIHLLGDHIQTDEMSMDSMMQSSCLITSTELLLVQNRVDAVRREHEKAVAEASTRLVPDVIEVRRSPLTCSLSVVLTQRLLCCCIGTQSWQRHFRQTKMVVRLLDVTVYALETECLFELATLLMDTLLVLSFTEFSKTIVLFHTPSKLWMTLLPPTGTTQPWYETKWIKLYQPAVKLVSNLLTNHKHMFVEEAIAFVAVHQDCIVGLLVGIRTATTMEVLQLAIMVLDLVRMLLQYYKPLWQFHHKLSYSNIIIAVMAALDTCVAFLAQPYVLYCVVECPGVHSLQEVRNQEGGDLEPSPRMVGVQNKLVEMACMCLVAIQPLCGDIMAVLGQPRDPLCHRTETLVDRSFMTPNLRKMTLGPLSFGSLITLANLALRGLTFKTTQPPGSSPLRHAAITTTCPSDKWLSLLDQQCLTLALELSLTTVLAQGLLVVEGWRAHEQESKLVAREIMSEMASFLEYVKRYILVDETEPKLSAVSLKRPVVFSRRSCVRKLYSSPPPDDAEESRPGTRQVTFSEQQPSPIRGDQASFKGEEAPGRFKLGNFGKKDGSDDAEESPPGARQVTFSEQQPSPIRGDQASFKGEEAPGRFKLGNFGKKDGSDDAKESPPGARQLTFSEQQPSPIRGDQASFKGEEAPGRFKLGNFGKKDGSPRVKQVTIVDHLSELPLGNDFTGGEEEPGRPRPTLGKHKDVTPPNIFGEPTVFKQGTFGEISTWNDAPSPPKTSFSIWNDSPSNSPSMDISSSTSGSPTSVKSSPSLLGSPSLQGSPLTFMHPLLNQADSPLISEGSGSGSGSGSLPLSPIPDTPESVESPSPGRSTWDEERTSKKYFQLLAHIFQSILRQI